jgi:hypothetical protein
MAVYRFFEIGEDDPIHQSPSMMDCPDDETAVRRAERLVGDCVVEGWDRSRLVVSLTPDLAPLASTRGELKPKRQGISRRKRRNCQHS